MEQLADRQAGRSNLSYHLCKTMMEMILHEGVWSG